MIGSPVISRKAAIAAGLRRYFTGYPCARNHIAERRVSSRQCVECSVFHKKTKENKAKEKIYRHSNSEILQKKKAAYYRANAKRIIARVANWQKANPEKRRYTRRKWESANKNQVMALVRNKRARRWAAPGTHTAVDINEILAAQKHRCAYCKKRLRGNYHVDHIRAVSVGGSNARNNLQVTCASCNTSKGAKDPADFARSIGMLI